MKDFFDRLRRSIASHRNVQYACALSGVLCGIATAGALAASGFLPPIPPSWSAEQTAQHYRDHHKGIQASAALWVIAGMFYLPFTAAMSTQMQRVPNLPLAISSLQLAAGSSSLILLMVPGSVLGVASYRLDRPVEIMQMLNDLFWITIMSGSPIYTTQILAITYAIIIDSRPKTLFPKLLAVFNIIVIILLAPAVVLHCFTTGPLAWNGSVNFWVNVISFSTMVFTDCIYLAWAAGK